MGGHPTAAAAVAGVTAGPGRQRTPAVGIGSGPRVRPGFAESVSGLAAAAAAIESATPGAVGHEFLATAKAFSQAMVLGARKGFLVAALSTITWNRYTSRQGWRPHHQRSPLAANGRSASARVGHHHSPAPGDPTSPARDHSELDRRIGRDHLT